MKPELCVFLKKPFLVIVTGSGDYTLFCLACLSVCIDVCLFGCPMIFSKLVKITALAFRIKLAFA